MLMAEHGAEFRASIDTMQGAVRARFAVVLVEGSVTRTRPGARLFDSRRQALAWLAAQARRHGFSEWNVEEGPGSEGLRPPQTPATNDSPDD